MNVLFVLIAYIMEEETEEPPYFNGFMSRGPSEPLLLPLRPPSNYTVKAKAARQEAKAKTKANPNPSKKLPRAIETSGRGIRYKSIPTSTTSLPLDDPALVYMRQEGVNITGATPGAVFMSAECYENGGEIYLSDLQMVEEGNFISVIYNVCINIVIKLYAKHNRQNIFAFSDETCLVFFIFTAGDGSCSAQGSVRHLYHDASCSATVSKPEEPMDMEITGLWTVRYLKFSAKCTITKW